VDIEKIFKRTYMHAISRENDPPREKHPTIERGDRPQQKKVDISKEMKDAAFILTDPSKDPKLQDETSVLGNKYKKAKEMCDAPSPPKAIKSKPKKNNPKPHKAASKKI
jgi:hypothetical protein